MNDLVQVSFCSQNSLQLRFEMGIEFYEFINSVYSEIEIALVFAFMCSAISIDF